MINNNTALANKKELSAYSNFKINVISQCSNDKRYISAGNITPNWWYQIFIDKHGNPDLELITLLSEIVYQFRPNEIIDFITGKSIFIPKRKTDGWYTSYEYIENKIGFKSHKTRNALRKLENKGIVKRDTKNVLENGHRVNKLVIYLNQNFFESCFNAPEQDVRIKLKVNELVTKSPANPVKTPSCQISQHHISNKNKNNIRSSRANFTNAKNSNFETLSTTSEKTKLVAKGKCDSSLANQPTTKPVETTQEAQTVETPSPTPAPVEQLQVKATRPSNKRKTKTCEQQKQRKAANVVSNGFLAEGKRLSEIQPYLTDELCEKLRTASGREFSNRAIRQIIKAIAASERGKQAFFYHINGVLSYLTPALANEKRDAVKTSGEHYYTLAGMTADDKLWQQQEQYLEETEQISIKQPCPEHQFRAKLANTLERSTAYNLLLAMQTLEVGNTFVISLNRQIELTERQKQVILSQAQAVFNSGGISENNQAIEKIQFMTDNQRFLHTIKKENNNQVSAIYNKVCYSSSNPVASSFYEDIENKSESAETQGLELPKSNWGKVCAAFISEYGYGLYKHWLESLSVEQTGSTIELQTNSGMVRDRIEQTYLPFLSKVADKLGINKLKFKR